MFTQTSSRLSQQHIFLISLFVLLARGAMQATDSPVPDSDNTNSGPSEDADQVFTLQPESLSYTTPKKVARLKCVAKNADDIHIRCNREYILENQITSSSESINGERIFTVEVDITKRMIYEWFTPEYWCECIAQMDNGNRQVTSRRGQFKVASLDGRFPLSPIESSVEETKVAEMACHPPKGDPPPQVYWEKNGVRIDDENDNHYIVSHDGSLIINEARASDEGNYTCVAYNGFFRRSSQPARLYVYKNGGWSPWSSFGECDTTCGNGFQRRFRTCTNPSPSGKGRKDCDGPSSQSSPCTKECPPVDGQWSSWGPWSKCDNCQQYRGRSCDNPSPVGRGKKCPGLAIQATNCSSPSCSGFGANASTAETKPEDRQNTILLIILCAAVAVFAVILVIIVMCLMKKKNRRNTMYEEDSNDVDNNSRSGEKFDSGSNAQPDVTKTFIPVRQHRPYAVSRTESVGSPAEKMPMFVQPSNQLPPNREYYMQISPNEACDHHDYMQIGGRESGSESGEDKISQNSSSPESGICNSCDRQSLLSGHLPASIDVEALAWGNVTHTGGRLTLANSGISITVPEGAIGRNQTEEIFIAASRLDKERPVLLGKQTLLSPILLCGPHNTTFNKSLILSFDHCAIMKLGQWKLSIYHSCTSYDEPPQWERLMTLNQEILHTPVFCQLDSNRCHVMVDQLASRYCLVGESMYGSKAVKQLLLAAFAIPHQNAMEGTVRVHVLPNIQDALSNVVQQENKLGSRLMDKPKLISFQDGGHNLCLQLDSISNGWISKIPAQYQEIPFQHVWNAQSNLHCSFAFERALNQPSLPMSCKIQVHQKSVLSNRQQLTINGGIEASMKMLGQKDLSSTVTVNTQSSSGCSSMVLLDNPHQQIFKLSSSTKKKLASHLDMPCMRGNDWRMLASALGSDRQLNFFSSKPSPTEAILDLWEARNNVEEALVTDLINIFKAMGRNDAAVILEQEFRNAWV